MAEYNNVQIRLRIDSKENWTSNNTVLANGEVGIVVDGSSIDLKAGNNGASFTSLPYLVGDNAAIINMGSRIDTTNNRINILQENVNQLGENVTRNQGNFDLDLMNNYTTSSKMLTEYIPATNVRKSTMIRQWSEWIKTGTLPNYRFTGAVSWDSVFLIISVMRKSGMISFTDEQAIDFGERLIVTLRELSNCPENVRRAALSTYRENVIGG